MLIIFASIAVFGVTSFIVQRLSQTQTNRLLTKTIYLAQSGIQSAIYSYRFRDISGNGYFLLGQTNIDADNFFVLGALDADLLMVDTRTSQISGSGGYPNAELRGLRIQNATKSKTITIDRMIVTWNNAQRLNVIRINGSNRWSKNPGFSSPADCDIVNFTLNTTPSSYAINYLRFSGNMTGASITIQFVMTDGSSETLPVYPASQIYNFSVNSMGQTSASNIFRTIKAEYNTVTARIESYNEISEIVP